MSTTTSLEELLIQITEWATLNANFVTFIAPDIDSYEMIFEAGKDERFPWVIGFDYNWNPLFIRSPHDGGVLSEWVNRMNTFIQRQRQNSLQGLLNEARRSLIQLFKIDLPPPAPQLKTVPPPAAVGDNPQQQQPSYQYHQLPPQQPQNIAGFDPDFTKRLSSMLSGAAPPTSTSGLDSAQEAVDDTPVTKEAIETLLSSYNPDILKLIEITEGEPNKISLTIGEPPMDFIIECNSTWVITSITSQHPQLNQFVPLMKLYIESQTPSIKTFIKHLQVLLKDSGKTIEEITEALNKAPDLLEEEEENEYIEPKTEDFEKIIFPTIHQYLIDIAQPEFLIDEWMRLIRIEYDNCTNEDYTSCLDYIVNSQIFEDIPLNLRKYIKRKPRYFPPPKFAMPHGVREEVKRHIVREAETIIIKQEGFKATPIRNNPFHWSIFLFDFDPSSYIYQQLLNYTISTDDPNQYQTGLIEPVSIWIEMKLPTNYPRGKPLFRILTPRFSHIEEDFFEFDFTGRDNDEEEIIKSEKEEKPILYKPPTTTETTITNYTSPEQDPAYKDYVPLKRDESEEITITNITSPEQDPNYHAMSEGEEKVITNITSPEQDPAYNNNIIIQQPQLPQPVKKKVKEPPLKLKKFILNLRFKLMNSKIALIDMTSSRKGIPTDGSFWHEYKCVSLKSNLDFGPESEVGGKIYLPTECLNELMANDRYGGGFGYYRNNKSNSPMVFEILSPNGKRSFCGVMEFIADPHTVGMPSWMMDHLGIEIGEIVQIRKVILPKGIFVQLQPHSADFSIVSDVKATLEWVLRRFVALSEGDTIQLEHDGIICKFNVLKCTPDNAIAITDQDVSVDIVSPLDGSKVYDPKAEQESQQKEIEELEKKMKSMGITLGTIEGVQGVDFEICKNCHQNVPIAQITMHELRCTRINWYCEVCNMVVLKTDKNKHEQEYHSDYTCEWCGDTMEVRLILDHKKNLCSLRSVSCQFCSLTMQYKKLYLHERSCGALTEVCPKCHSRYPRSDLAVHEPVCTGIPVPPAPHNPLSSYSPRNYKNNNYNNYNNYTNNNRNRKNNDIMICEICQQALSSFEELQIHHITEHIEKEENPPSELITSPSPPPSTEPEEPPKDLEPIIPIISPAAIPQQPSQPQNPQTISQQHIAEEHHAGSIAAPAANEGSTENSSQQQQQQQNEQRNGSQNDT